MIDLFIPEKSIGWLYLTINGNVFRVSYLNDFISDMKRLLTLDKAKDTKVNRVYFDGEGDDLYLTAWKNDDTLFLAWEVETKAGLRAELMQFKYEDFLKEFYNKFELIKDDYYKRFDLDSII